MEVIVTDISKHSSFYKSRSLASYLYHEVRGASQLVFDSLAQKSQEFRFTPHTKIALILPGFMAPTFVYNSLALYLRTYGIFAAVGRYGLLNLPNYRRQARVLKQSTDRFKRKFGRIDYIIGHSLGGLEAVALLSQYPYEIKKVIAIAAPFNERNSWKIVKFGANSFVVPEPMQRRILSKIIRSGVSFADKIVTISSVHDKFVSPEQARFPGARNIIVDGDEVIDGASKDLYKHEEVYQTHIGITNSQYVRECILRPELGV